MITQPKFVPDIPIIEVCPYTKKTSAKIINSKPFLNLVAGSTSITHELRTADNTVSYIGFINKCKNINEKYIYFFPLKSLSLSLLINSK